NAEPVHAPAGFQSSPSRRKSRIFPSAQDVSRYLQLPGLKVTPKAAGAIAPGSALMTLGSLSLSTSQILTVPSRLAVATCSPSGLNTESVKAARGFGCSKRRRGE